MLLLLRRGVILIMVREISQEPYHHRANQDDAAHLLKILLTLLPGVSENRFCCRHPIWRQFHHKRQIILLKEIAEDLGSKNCHKDSQGIHSQQHQPGILREEGSRNQDIYRHSARTRHKRNYQSSDKSALRTLDGAGRHDRRHIASESHYHRDERLAVKTDLMHQTVHYEGCPCHISRVFQ